MNRRSFMKKGMVAAAAAAGLSRFSFAEEGKKIPVALQVYSVRDAAANDLPGTLKQIADIGFTGVEFAGYYGHSASDIRKMLDDVGLVAVSSHIGIGPLLGDAFPETVEFTHTLGNHYLIVAGGLDKAYSFDAGNQMTAHLFNELAAKAEKEDLQVGFHSHAGDFALIGDKTAWELFFSRTRPDVVAQVDVGNTLSAGADPYAAMEAFPGRGKLIHIKSSGPYGCCVGDSDDQVDWKRTIDLCRNVAGTEWYIIEQESAKEGLSAMDACRVSFEQFQKLIS